MNDVQIARLRNPGGTRRVLGLMVLLLAAIQIGRPAPVSACVGARPLGMGGAFIAVADDANVPYWNPAALALIRTRQATVAYVGGDDINYKWFGSYSQPFGQQFAAAASIFTWNPRIWGFIPGDPEPIEFKYTRPWVSMAMALPNVTKGELAIGANLSFGQAELTWRNEKETLDVDPGLDLSAIYRLNEQWSFGLLVQDVNEPEMKLNGTPVTKWMRNIRPGIAFRPNEQLTLAADIYLFTEEDYIMLGAEYWINEQVGVRGGMYSIGGTEWPTAGASYRFTPEFSVEGATLDFEYWAASATFAF